MKRLLQKFVRGFGYDIRRLPDGRGEALYPYVAEFKKDNLYFKYWITDETYRDWYKPDQHAAWHETSATIQLVAQGNSILEIGSNNGFTMCLLKSITGTDALFVGMEIIPSNCQVANSQIGLNSLQNCHMLHLGGSDRSESVRVFNTNNGFITSDTIQNVIEVQTIPPDELISTYGYFDVLKIDVEGFEGRVLKGSRRLLERTPKLIVELHGADVSRYGSSYKEIFDLIGIEKYEGSMCLRNDNELRRFDPERLLRDEPHATMFLTPRQQPTELSNH